MRDNESNNINFKSICLWYFEEFVNQIRIIDNQISL